jgi:hypothetical protein
MVCPRTRHRRHRQQHRSGLDGDRSFFLIRQRSNSWRPAIPLSSSSVVPETTCVRGCCRALDVSVAGVGLNDSARTRTACRTTTPASSSEQRREYAEDPRLSGDHRLAPVASQIKYEQFGLAAAGRKSFRIGGDRKVELIGQVFNLFTGRTCSPPGRTTSGRTSSGSSSRPATCARLNSLFGLRSRAVGSRQ